MKQVRSIWQRRRSDTPVTTWAYTNKGIQALSWRPIKRYNMTKTDATCMHTVKSCILLMKTVLCLKSDMSWELSERLLRPCAASPCMHGSENFQKAKWPDTNMWQAGNLQRLTRQERSPNIDTCRSA